MRLIRRHVVVFGAMLLAVGHGVAPAATGQERGGTAPATTPRAAYLQRGDEVEARYRGYRERLERFFEEFGAQLAAGAPELLAKLRAAPPAPVPYGYGILPKLVPDAPRTSRARLVSVSYSWRRTDGFIERDLGRLEKLEGRLAQTTRMTGEERLTEWAEMVDEYRGLAANQKLTASHIEHNRLWQAEIARNRRGYDLQTSLHDAVLERQALLDTLQAGDQVLEPDLRAREEALSRRILEATSKLSPPDFVQVEQPSPHRWVVRVPIHTDIDDRSFVEAFRSAVENAWQVRDGGEDEFSVALDIRWVPATELYKDGAPPARGEHIDMWPHIHRFPAGGAVLTTGANSTYVLGRSIDVGPHDVAPNVLAHEFGHILGFADGYFRGYRDRGPEGFEVLEVVIDAEDIMSAPGTGRVWRRHFQQLLDARASR